MPPCSGAHCPLPCCVASSSRLFQRSAPLTDRDRRIFARNDPRRHPLDKWPDLKRALLSALYNIDRHDAKPPIRDEVLQGETLAREFARDHGFAFEGVDRRTARQKQDDWLAQRSESVRRAAKERPMDRIYRLRGGLVSAESNLPPFGTIVSYLERPGGVVIGVACIGVQRGPGSREAPLWATPDGLEDITEPLRNKLLGGQSTR